MRTALLLWCVRRDAPERGVEGRSRLKPLAGLAFVGIEVAFTRHKGIWEPVETETP